MAPFTLRTLLLAVTLITVGMIGVAMTFRAEWTGHDFVSPLFTVCVSSAVIGAGIGAPFRLKTLGALLGFFSPFAIAAFFGPSVR
jgi:hypothetical protein